MKIWIALLRGLGFLWITLGAVLIIVGIVGTWMQGGFSAVQELMSPFNFKNYLAIVITLAPGMAALFWADKLAAKKSRATVK